MENDRYYWDANWYGVCVRVVYLDVVGGELVFIGIMGTAKSNKKKLDPVSTKWYR